MAERRGLLGPVNADDLEPELGLSEAFSRNPQDWMGGMTKPQKQLLQQMEYYLRNGPAPDVAPSYEGLING